MKKPMIGFADPLLKICSYLEALEPDRGWMKKVIQGESICVRINDENSIYFKPGKGLRQGNPLSPLMFNLVADIFTIMLLKPARNNLITGLLPRAVEGGLPVCSMQMILFFSWRTI